VDHVPADEVHPVRRLRHVGGEHRGVAEPEGVPDRDHTTEIGDDVATQPPAQDGDLVVELTHVPLLSRPLSPC
jgi:hypothetical protein